MTRHIADHRSASEGGRLKHFLAVEKSQSAEGSHPATKILHARPSQRDDAKRLKRFVRIERGHSA